MPPEMGVPGQREIHAEDPAGPMMSGGGFYPGQARLSDREFQNFAGLIHRKCAIKLSPLKKTMLASRLNRRLRALGISTFGEYYDYVTSPRGEAAELVHLLNEVSTNKTDFFREPDHFSYLTSHLLEEFHRTACFSGKMFRVWSAGCSSGEEPYTIAMVLASYQEENPWFNFSVTATDISTKMLAVAEKGIYSDDRLATMAAGFRMKYMMRGKGVHRGRHRVVPEIRRKITFKRFNFLEKKFDLSRQPFDLIFCRNVIIYFDQPTQIDLFRKFHGTLRPGGYLFIGHSETLPGLEEQYERVASAIYRRTGG